MNKRLRYDPRVYFAACLVPVLAANLLCVLVAVRYSVDRGMWPLLLVMLTVLSIVYAAVACLPAARAWHYDAALALALAALLGAVLVAHSFAYYLLAPDWNAVRTGGLRLTLLQRLVFGAWMPWAIYLAVFLVLAWKLGAFRRQDPAPPDDQ